MLVHGEQSIELEGAIPVTGTGSCVAEITGIYDKGKGAVVAITGTTSDAATGTKLFSQTASLFIRGEGGWGGDRGPSGPKNVPPERAPDHSVTYQTREDQALTYRLSGDRNPLHAIRSSPSWPAFPSRSSTVCAPTDSPAAPCCTRSATAIRPGSARSRVGYSSPVFPGEALTVNMWVDGNEAVFQTAGDDGRVVLDGGRCTFSLLSRWRRRSEQLHRDRLRPRGARRSPPRRSRCRAIRPGPWPAA